jgi:transposase
MDKTQGIMQLFAAGMSERQIARTLDIDRKSVDRELRSQGAKGARQTKAPTGSASLGSEVPKGAKAPTGGEAPDSAVIESSKNAAEVTPAIDPNPSRSQCQAFHDLITQKLEKGLDAQRVYQDLVRDHGFPGSYYSVRRYVRHLGNRLVDPVRRIELPPAEEMQVDYGMGAPCKDHTGKLRRTYIFRCVLSYSRKGYTEAVTRLTTESFIRSMENAFRAFGGVTKTVVFDNAKAVVKQADWYDPELNPKIISFCKHYGFALLPTRPRTPQHKGKVERGVDYVQENCVKGMTFESLTLQNQHIEQWERSIADTRIHGTTKKHVGKQFLEIEKGLLSPLPKEHFPLYEEGIRKVSRDGHIEVKGSFYSAPPEYLGCEIRVQWNARVVRLMNHRHEQIGIHVRMERGKYSTLSEHIPPRKISGIERGSQYLLHKAKLIGPHSSRWAECVLKERGVHGMRAIQGLLSFTSQYESAAIERATEVAWRSGTFNSRVIRRLLKNGGSRQETMDFIDEHPVIRSVFEYDAFFRKALAEG